MRVNDIMSVRETAGHLIDGLDGRAARLCRGAERLRPPLHLLRHPLRPRQFALGRRPARWSSRSAAWPPRAISEVVLTGVDITSWGADLPGAPTLGQLVARILKLVPELPRLRLSSIDAAEIDADLMALPRRGAAAHAAPAPVAAVGRRHDPQADEAAPQPRRRPAADRTRSARVRPDTAFGADLIAGFPTETEAMFENTLALVEEAGSGLPARLSLSARDPARRRRACRRCRARWSRNARGAAARGGRGGAGPASGSAGRPADQRPGGALGPGPGGGFGSSGANFGLV